jgi:phosphatidate cytidylyltransferase
LFLFSTRSNAIAGIGVMLTGFFYISLSFFLLGQLREFYLLFPYIENFGFFIVIIMFCSIWICDSAAYFIGRKFGKHKLLERVSPKKSIEGAVAGFIASAVFFPLASYFFIPEFSTVYAIILGVIVGIFGQIGDLVESKLKRDADVKDSSDLIPGHGGILDRFDSIIFVSPIVFIFLVIVEFIR